MTNIKIDNDSNIYVDIVTIVMMQTFQRLFCHSAYLLTYYNLLNTDYCENFRHGCYIISDTRNLSKL